MVSELVALALALPFPVPLLSVLNPLPLFLYPQVLPLSSEPAPVAGLLMGCPLKFKKSPHSVHPFFPVSRDLGTGGNG